MVVENKNPARSIKITKIITDRNTAETESAWDEDGVMPHLQLKGLSSTPEDRD